LQQDEFSLWNDYVFAHPEGTVFQTTNWLSQLDKDVNVMAVMDEGKIMGGLSYVFTVKKSSKGLHIPPYTQYFSPLAGAPGSSDDISGNAKIVELILNNLPKASHIDFKLPAGHQNILPYYWKGYDSSVTITHRVHDFSDVLSIIHKSKKRYLNKLIEMEKKGVLQFDANMPLKDVIDLQEVTGKRGGFDIKRDVLMKFEGNPNIVTTGIRHQTEGLLAGALLAFDNKCMYFLINASKRHEDSTLNKVNLLSVYNVLLLAKEKGLFLDYEGSMIKGIEEFYRHMGGKQYPIYRVQKSPSLYYSVLRAGKQILNDRKKA
jgi:hypothetical protein